MVKRKPRERTEEELEQLRIINNRIGTPYRLYLIVSRLDVSR